VRWEYDNILLMKSNDKICHQITLKSEKERDLYKKREERAIPGTPKVILGKSQSNAQ